MVFASPIFLFLFLPLVLTAYFALPRHWGNTALLVASIVFYVWGEGAYVALVLGSVVFNWIVGGLLGAADPGSRRRWLALGVGGNLALLASSSTRISRSPTSTPRLDRSIGARLHWSRSRFRSSIPRQSSACSPTSSSRRSWSGR